MLSGRELRGKRERERDSAGENAGKSDGSVPNAKGNDSCAGNETSQDCNSSREKHATGSASWKARTERINFFSCASRP